MLRVGLLLILSVLGAGGVATGAGAASSAWDGEWSGTWDAVKDSRFTIVDGRLVSFEYQGHRLNIAHSVIEPDKLSFIFVGSFDVDSSTPLGRNAGDLPNFDMNDTLVNLTLQNFMHASGRYDGPRGSAFGTFTKTGDLGGSASPRR